MCFEEADEDKVELILHYSCPWNKIETYYYQPLNYQLLYIKAQK